MVADVRWVLSAPLDISKIGSNQLCALQQPAVCPTVSADAVVSSGGCHCEWALSSTDLCQFLSLIVLCLPSQFTFCLTTCWIQSSSVISTRNTHSHDTFAVLSLRSLKKVNWQEQFTSPRCHFKLNIGHHPGHWSAATWLHTNTSSHLVWPHHFLLHLSSQPTLLIAWGSLRSLLLFYPARLSDSYSQTLLGRPHPMKKSNRSRVLGSQNPLEKVLVAIRSIFSIV